MDEGWGVGEENTSEESCNSGCYFKASRDLFGTLQKNQICGKTKKKMRRMVQAVYHLFMDGILKE